MSIPVGTLDRHRDGFVLVAVSLLATIPVWIPSYPPMVDLPQHAAQVTLLRDLQDPNFGFPGLFEVNWFTPYLLGYSMVYAVASAVGIVVACKVVVSLALAGLPFATALLMTETGTDRRWALLTIPAMYGFSYQWGFLNFIVAAPLGLIFLWLAMRHARSSGFHTSVWVAVMCNVLFFCHALVCVFFSLIAVCYIVFEVGNLETALRRVAPLAGVLPVMAVWGIRTLAHPTARMPVVWDIGLDRVTGLMPRLLGVPSNFVSLGLGLAIVCLPLLADARLNGRRTTWIPFLMCVGVLLLVPHGLFGNTFTYHRFGVFALPLYLIGFTDSPSTPRHRWIRRAVPLAAVAWTAVVGAYTLRYQSEVRGFGGIIDRMAPGQRALSLIFSQDSRGSSEPTFQHFPSWYAAQKRGVVDPSFAATYVGLVRCRQAGLPRARRMFELSQNPAQFDWGTFHGADYRYFVVRGSSDLGPFLFRNAPCPVRLIYDSNGWWLYEKDGGCPASSGAGGLPLARPLDGEWRVTAPEESVSRYPGVSGGSPRNDDATADSSLGRQGSR